MSVCSAQYDNVAIRGRIHVVWSHRETSVPVPGSGRNLSPVLDVRRKVGHQRRQHRLLHGDLDEPPTAGHLTLIQGRHNCCIEMNAAEEVGNCGSRLQGWVFGPARTAQTSSHGLPTPVHGRM